MTETTFAPRPLHSGPVTVREYRGLASRRSWAELVYAIVDLPWTIVAFTVLTTIFFTGLGLSVIYVGIAMVLASVFLARGIGAVQRGLARSLMGVEVTGPQPFRRARKGLFGLVADALTDRAAWRAAGYVTLKLVLAPFVFGIGITLYSGIGLITYPAWRTFLPAELGSDGLWHRGAQLWPDLYIDTWPLMALYVAAGVVMVLLAPRMVRWALSADRALVARLLSGNPA